MKTTINANADSLRKRELGSGEGERLSRLKEKQKTKEAAGV